MTGVKEITAPGNRLVCDEDGCKNKFITRKRLEKHMKDKHYIQIPGTSKQSDIVDSQQISQSSQDSQVISQINRDEEEALQEAVEDQELSDILDQIEREIREKDSELNEELGEKVERLREVIKKKGVVQMQLKKMHDDEMGKRNEVEENQKLVLDKLKDECKMLRERSMSIMKDSKKKKTTVKDLEKQITNKDTIINDLRVTNGIMWKENSDLKIEIENKTEQNKRNGSNSDGTDKDDTEVTIVETANVLMNKESLDNKCHACNNSFMTSNQLEKHIQAKHTQKVCNFCEDELPNAKELRKHLDKCEEYGNTTVVCNKCQKTVARFGLKNHIEKCNRKQDVFSCPKCGQKGSSMNEIKKHVAEEHIEDVFSCPKCGQKGSSINEIKKHIAEVHSAEVEKSREVCPHWRRGSCFRGDHCNKSHVGYQQKSTEVTTGRTSTTSWMPACRNGEKWMTKGTCQFFHRGIGVQKSATTGAQFQQKRTSPLVQKLCRYNETCFRKSTCSFKHTSSENFSPQRGHQRPPARSNWRFGQ